MYFESPVLLITGAMVQCRMSNLGDVRFPLRYVQYGFDSGHGPQINFLPSLTLRRHTPVRYLDLMRPSQHTP